MADVKYTFRNREVTSPLGKAGVLAFLVLIGLPLLCLGLCAMVVLLPVLVPGHFLLRALGRQGFVFHTGNTLSLSVRADSFRKA